MYSSINFLSLILAIIAIMIAWITLVYAIKIRNSEKETKKELIQNKKNRFEFMLRNLAVYFYQMNEINFLDNEHVSDDFIKNSFVQPMILLKDLRIALNDYNYVDLHSLHTLQIMESTLFRIQQSADDSANKTIHLRHMLKEPIHDLEKIAKKYGFDPLSV